mgnify:CR=1 FL=1|tara:strand:+ start:1350 stop:2666 length:1317 start_codon:yes stop_codon:yes gene_type:complete
MKHPLKVSKIYLFKLSIPIFFANLAIPLVGLVDTGLMGHLSSTKYLVAVSISSSVISMVFWSFGFLRMGTVGLVAQSLGRGDYRDIVSTTLRNLIIALFFALIIISLRDIIISLIKDFFETSDETQILIKKYISIRILSAPAELIMYVLIGLYLGLQRTFTSSFLITFFSITNIIFSTYFVISLNLEVYGVALGTVLSAYLTAFIFLISTYFFIKKQFNIIPRLNKILITKKIIKLFSINFDIFIRTIFLTFAFLWIPYQGSKLGEDYLAANSILIQFILMASFFLDAYAFSTEGVVGYTIGRKAKKSFLQAVSNSFKLSFFTGLMISVVYLFFFKNIISTLTNIDYLIFLSFNFAFWVMVIPPVASFCYQFDGIFIGASQTAELRNSMIISVVLFVLFSIYLIDNLGNHGLWLSLLFFMIIRALTLNFYFPKILRKF